MLHLYNDRTQELEPFRVLDREASLYVCGITPYDTTHLGHAFTYSSFDVLIRYLEWQGLRVRYIQNVTDIDDDILRKAREVGEDWLLLGNRWVRHYIDDMEALNIRAPDVFPRATEVIPEMIRVIATLLDLGYAYVRGGSVYYRARLAPFGSISRMAAEDRLRIASERGNVPTDPNKEDPLDFVLWQAWAPGEPAWPSPWGAGRPGWHIECSTMVNLHLGATVDIHGGGEDLAFPHHECEIAQAEGYTGRQPFARYWLHTAMVRYLGEKMSKSLGNLVMVSRLLEDYAPDALRLYLASHHYRDSWSYDQKALQQAAAAAGRWQAAARAAGGRGRALASEDCRAQFQVAMDDDLRTPEAIGALNRLADAILSASQQGEDIAAAQATLCSLAGILGLRLARPGPEPRVVAAWQVQKARFRTPEAEVAAR